MIIPQTIYISHFRDALRGLCLLFGYRGSFKQDMLGLFGQTDVQDIQHIFICIFSSSFSWPIWNDTGWILQQSNKSAVSRFCIDWKYCGSSCKIQTIWRDWWEPQPYGQRFNTLRLGTAQTSLSRMWSDCKNVGQFCSQVRP